MDLLQLVRHPVIISNINPAKPSAGLIFAMTFSRSMAPTERELQTGRAELRLIERPSQRKMHEDASGDDLVLLVLPSPDISQEVVVEVEAEALGARGRGYSLGGD